MLRIVGVCIVVAFLGGCYVVPVRNVEEYVPRGRVIFINGRPSCIIPDDGLMEWAKSVPGADRVYHEREAAATHLDYGEGVLRVCSSSERAGSSSHREPNVFYHPYYPNRRW
jgi:hypothetical protein